ncbi:hypothetical protein PENSPDRAFT_754144 [Peniophora sp. CONT]|nr:hypothetical protein PENSPDRAFT_754144 [Peniophora sp. CONT]
MAHISSDDNECGDDRQIGSNLENQHGRIHMDPGIRPGVPTACIADSLYTIMAQLSLLIEDVFQWKGPSDVATTYPHTHHIQEWTYTAYRASLNQQANHPRVNALMAVMVSTTDAILPIATTYLQRRADYVDDIMRQLFWWAVITLRLIKYNKISKAASRQNPEGELARLTLLIVTPDPACGVNSTSASSNRHTISGIIAKDTLLFVLEGIVQSSDAFPPLKSAASGLLFFATSAEMASSNKKLVRDIYKRIDGLTASLRRGTGTGSPLTLEHQEAIKSLADDIEALNEELNDIVAERKNRFKRFFAAKRHRNELQDIVMQLDNTRMNYMMAMATLNATTNANVLAHVQAYSVVLGTSPVYAPGTRRADAIAFPFGTSRVEEV